MNARYYDTRGVFISPDPIVGYAGPQTLNRFAYSIGNPATYSDPSGLCTKIQQATKGCNMGKGPRPENEYKTNDEGKLSPTPVNLARTAEVCGVLGFSSWSHDSSSAVAHCGEAGADIPGTGGRCVRYFHSDTCDSTQFNRSVMPWVGCGTGIAADTCGLVGFKSCALSAQIVEIAADTSAVYAECNRPGAIDAKACQGNINSLEFDLLTSLSVFVPGSGGQIVSGLIAGPDIVLNPWATTFTAQPGCHVVADVLLLGLVNTC